MKKAIRLLVVCTAALAVVAMPTPVFALCGNSQILQHQLDGFFSGCPDLQPVSGFGWVIGQEATFHTGTVDIACEDAAGFGQLGAPCWPQSGSAGDGLVSILFNWANAGAPAGTACPNPTEAMGIARNAVSVVANDGSSVLASVGFSPDFGGYLIELAHPGGGFEPLSCSLNNGLTVQSVTPGLQQDTVCLTQAPTPLHSDCDPGSLGEALGTCTEGAAPQTGPGNLYTVNAPCNSAPDARRASWTLLNTTTGPGGSKCGLVNKPTDALTCAFVGGTTTIGGVESAAITGHLRVAGLAAPDKVAIKKAELLQGKLQVDFSTENESAIVGFNVYAGTSKLNSGLISAKGIGNNDYTFEVGRGALKNERSITVEAVKSDGTTIRSGSVSVK